MGLNPIQAMIDSLGESEVVKNAMLQFGQMRDAFINAMTYFKNCFEVNAGAQAALLRQGMETQEMIRTLQEHLIGDTKPAAKDNLLLLDQPVYECMEVGCVKLGIHEHEEGRPVVCGKNTPQAGIAVVEHEQELPFGEGFDEEAIEIFPPENIM